MHGKHRTIDLHKLRHFIHRYCNGTLLQQISDLLFVVEAIFLMLKICAQVFFENHLMMLIVYDMNRSLYNINGKCPTQIVSDSNYDIIK